MQTSPSRQTHATLLTLSFLTALLTLSTFFQFTGGLFFTFVLLNGALQATAGAYLQTSVVAVASLFGPAAVQAMMSGQAAVAVVVSGVQVLSAAVFLLGESRESKTFDIAIAAAEERSASVFFALSTLFLLLCAAAHAWLARLPTYKIIAAPLEQHKAARSATQSMTSTGRREVSDEKARILQLAKANITYEIAIAYVFVITIVCNFSSPPPNFPTYPVHRRQYSHQLLTRFSLLMLRSILCFSPLFTFWSSPLEI